MTTESETKESYELEWRGYISSLLEKAGHRRLSESEWRWLKRNYKGSRVWKRQIRDILRRRVNGRRRHRRRWYNAVR